MFWNKKKEPPNKCLQTGLSANIPEQYKNIVEAGCFQDTPNGEYMIHYRYRCENELGSWYCNIYEAINEYALRKTKEDINNFALEIMGGQRYSVRTEYGAEIVINNDIERILNSMFYNTRYRKLLRKLLDRYEALIENKG
jgi:hypothetical protein